MSESAKRDIRGIRYDILDPDFEEMMAKIAHFGAVKYGEFNWHKSRLTGDQGPMNHIRKHYKSYMKGEPYDHHELGKDRKIHLAAIAFNAMMEYWYECNTPAPIFKTGDLVIYKHYYYRIKELYTTTALLRSDDEIEQTVFVSDLCHYSPRTGIQAETASPHVGDAYPLGAQYFYKGIRLYGARGIVLEPNSNVVLKELQGNSALVSWNTATFAVKLEDLCPYLPKT